MTFAYRIDRKGDVLVITTHRLATKGNKPLTEYTTWVAVQPTAVANSADEANDNHNAAVRGLLKPGVPV